MLPVALRAIELERLARAGYLLLLADVGEPVDGRFEGDATEVEALAAGADGRGYLVRFRRREDEDDVRRRLLERLQEGIRGLGGEHVGFVEDVDLEVGATGRIADFLAQVLDGIDAAVAGGVELDEVHGAAFAEGDAGVALVARLAILRVATVRRLGEETAGAGLAGAARAAKQVRMGYFFRRHSVAEGAHNGLLTRNLAEPLGTVLTIEDFGSHYSTEIISFPNSTSRVVWCDSMTRACSSVAWS